MVDLILSNVVDTVSIALRLCMKSPFQSPKLWVIHDLCAVDSRTCLLHESSDLIIENTVTCIAICIKVQKDLTPSIPKKQETTPWTPSSYLSYSFDFVAPSSLWQLDRLERRNMDLDRCFS